ncbi:MAG TPA: hypothetical protein VF950_20715 [Planctomycetota bacterium]
MRAGLLLLLAGCGLPAPTARDFEIVRLLPPPPGPYVRVKAVADLVSEHMSGTFDVLVLARGGPRPLVRLQLLPDLGGKALDLVVSPDRLQGRFPATGESVDWSLPDEARAHPLLFIGLTLLERFAPVTEDRVTGAASVSGTAAGVSPSIRIFEVTPVVEGMGLWLAGRLWEPGGPYETRMSWGWVRWILFKDEVLAKGFHLKLRDVKIETLASIDESLLKLK